MLNQADIKEIQREGQEELDKIASDEAMLALAIEKCRKSAERK